MATGNKIYSLMDKCKGEDHIWYSVSAKNGSYKYRCNRCHEEISIATSMDAWCYHDFYTKIDQGVKTLNCDKCGSSDVWGIQPTK